MAKRRDKEDFVARLESRTLPKRVRGVRAIQAWRQRHRISARACEYGYLNASELAADWGYTPQGVAKMIRYGRIKGKNPFGNEWWVEIEDARRYAREHDLRDPLTGWQFFGGQLYKEIA